MRRIGYAVLGNTDRQLASTRISIFNTLGKLRERGYQPEIVDQGAIYNPDRDLSQLAQQVVSRRFSQRDIVYFQSLRIESAIAAANALRRQGIPTVFGVCNDRGRQCHLACQSRGAMGLSPSRVVP